MNPNEVKRRRIQVFADFIALMTVIIIGRMAGDNGVTYAAAAILPVSFLWALCGGSTADTLGRLLRIRNTKGQYKNAEKMWQSVMVLQLAVGLAGGAALLFGAGIIGERLFHVQYSVFLIMLLAPVPLLRGISDVLMGGCQGEGAELPTAVASVLRQVLILVFSLIFCRMLGNYGGKVSRLLVEENFASMYTAAGAAIAVNISEILVILFLLFIQKMLRRSGRREQPVGMRSTDSFLDAAESFTLNRAPYFAVQLLLLLPVILGLLFFQKSVADWKAGATEYGIYFGKYLVVILFLVLAMSCLFMQVCSKAVINLRKGEQRFARVIFQGGVHITVVHSLYLAVFLAVMGTHVANLLGSGGGAAAAGKLAALFGVGNSGAAGKMLQGGAMIIPFAALTVYFSRFLILTGKNLLILGALAIADIIYVVSMTLFLNVGKAGIQSLVYAGVIGSVVCCVLLGIVTYRQLRLGSMWLHTFVIPAGAACVSGLLCLLLSRLLSPRLNDAVALLVCGLLSAAVYWVILLLARDFGDQELECIPGGRVIASLAQMFHVL